MSRTAGWDRRLKRLDAALPQPPAGARHWLELFEMLGELQGLAAREPDFAGLLRAYRALRPPYDAEAAEGLHGHLCELSARAEAGVPPCSAAEFAGLAAWLAANGGSLPTVTGWKKDIELGDGTTTTLYDLSWRVGRGVGARGSGGVAEAIRGLRSRHGEAPRPARAEGERDAGRDAGRPPWAGASVVRDDGEESGPP